MNIIKYLLLSTTLLFFITTEIYADDNDKKKYLDKDGKKYHEKKWKKKGKWKQCPMKNMFEQCPMMGRGSSPMKGTVGAFTMIEAQGRLFLYNKRNGDVWVCSAFKKTCEQLIVENKDKNIK